MSYTLALLINGFVTLFVGIDATKKEKNAWGWGTLTILFGFLPLGIYLIHTKRIIWGVLCIVAWCVVIALVGLLIGLAATGHLYSSTTTGP